MTPNCKQIDLGFLLSEQKVSEDLTKKKMVASNAYYGKVPDGKPFPLRSGTRIKGNRLGRITPPDGGGWQPVEDGLCSTNACDSSAEVVSHGNEEFYFSLVQKALRTDWLCLDALALREVPEEEIAHLESGLQSASRYVHEEFRRTRYLHFCANKMVTVLAEEGSTGMPLSENVTSCDGDEQDNNGWIWETRDNGEIDENHVRVCVNPEKPGLIGGLSLDNLDYASERLGYEDESYMGGTMLFDVLLANIKLSNQLALQEDDKMNNAASYGGYNMLELAQAYGTQRVLRNYSLRSDMYSARFYPDAAFNALLADEDGYAFDEDDPNTWARFVRVYPFLPRKANVSGIDKITNPNYLRAPFGISTILSQRVMSVMSFPDISGFGSAQKAEMFGFDGVAKWINPDRECNEDRNKGFWKLKFRLAARPDYDKEGFAWFHRLSNKVDLTGLRCAIPEAATYSDVTPYCYEGMGATDEDDVGVGGNGVVSVG